jgi:hypothetical protein
MAMRLTDLFKVPTILDVDGSKDHTPYRASCPEGDWRSPRWVSSTRTAREQQLQHWTREHFHYNAGAWGAGPSDGGFGSGWGSGLDY